MMFLLALVLAYLFGSIPFGLLLTKAAGKGDVREIGSGNIGATNVLRTGSKWLAATTLVMDGLKGYVAVRLGYWLGGMEGYAYDAELAAALLAVLGHMFPAWLKFKGGKGVATTIGVFIGLAPWLGLCVIVLWLVTFGFTRISSLAALVAIGAAPVVSLLVGDMMMLIISLPIAALVFWRHRENIQRLKHGTEHRFRSAPPAA